MVCVPQRGRLTAPEREPQEESLGVSRACCLVDLALQPLPKVRHQHILYTPVRVFEGGGSRCRGARLGVGAAGTGKLDHQFMRDGGRATLQCLMSFPVSGVSRPKP